MCYEAQIRQSFFMVSIYIILVWVSMSIVLTQVVVPSFQDATMLVKLFILHEHNNLQNKKNPTNCKMGKKCVSRKDE
jgi:hypothetical protein